MKLDTLKGKLVLLEKRRAELFELQKPINKELVTNYDKIEDVKNKIGKLQVADMKTPDWKELLTENNGAVLYEKYNKELEIRCLYGGGMLPSTGQRCIKVKLKKGDKKSYTSTIDALEEVLPFVKPFPNNEKSDIAGYKFVDIFEETLSENGSYYMLIKTNDYRLMRDWHCRTEELKRFKSLAGIIKYIQEHHPYES